MKATKYKGKYCSPEARTLNAKKNTRDWCGGKVGIEHDWWWFESQEDFHGLTSHQRRKCRRCGKQSGLRYKKHPFGRVFAAWRHDIGLTQEDISKRLGVPQSVVARLEADQHSPSLQTMERYVKALGLSLRVEIQKSHYYWGSLLIGESDEEVDE